MLRLFGFLLGISVRLVREPRFLGDGINDAPAMKVADVGVSVDAAVDIAKESVDVILLEKDLMILYFRKGNLWKYYEIYQGNSKFELR